MQYGRVVVCFVSPYLDCQSIDRQRSLPEALTFSLSSKPFTMEFQVHLLNTNPHSASPLDLLDRSLKDLFGALLQAPQL